MAKADRVGQRFISKPKLGECEFIIIEYNKRNDVWVQFQDEYGAKVHTTYQHCVEGGVVNPYAPSVFGVGYIGQGEYRSSINNENTKEYLEWRSFIQRGCDKEYKKLHPTYKDVTVEEWLFNFQNYCNWREENYYEIEGEQMCLDKDILVKGNKIYSRNTMIFVPQRINKLFLRNEGKRGEYPIGVSYNKRNDKYMAKCRILDKNNNKADVFLGYYNNPEQAFKAYKQFKEQYIKEVADEYKGRIPDRLYEAMYTYKVEITD